MTTISNQYLAILRAGSLAGILSALIFAIAHNLFIENIWYAIFFLVSGGMIGGITLAFNYFYMTEIPTAQNWAMYNFIFVTKYILLGVVSILVFEPVTTIPEILEINRRSGDMYTTALPLTVAFTLIFSFLMSLMFATKIKQFLLIIITNIIMMVALGINVSILGLVYTNKTSFELIMEVTGLIVLIMGTFSFGFLLFGKKIFLSSFDTRQYRSRRVNSSFEKSDVYNY